MQTGEPNRTEALLLAWAVAPANKLEQEWGTDLVAGLIMMMIELNDDLLMFIAVIVLQAQLVGFLLALNSFDILTSLMDAW